jgi:CRISPR-associated protein Csy2
MIKCPDFEHLLIIPRLRVQNANAISGPLTHGFPSMTAFLGLMWALERKTTVAEFDLRFNAVGVVCHQYQEQTARGFVDSFCLTRNPVEKDGKTAAIVEEGRIHLDVSLVFAVKSDTLTNALGEQETLNDIAKRVSNLLKTMRIAGGSVIPSNVPTARQTPHIYAFTGNSADQQRQFRRLKYRLLPGFALVARDDLLAARHKDLQQEDPRATRLDAWLSLARVDWRPTNEEKNGKVKWRPKYERKGWIVPIPVGYGALSGPHPAGTVANARDATTPFCFAEGVYSVGEWLGPHRLASPQQLLWYADYQESQGLYRCRNDYRAPSDGDDYDFD